ncbi:hypothetical protein P9112_010900 [Eukaryota sp. TZLM1-RC]
MRMRCYLWPCNLPNDLFCKCGAGLTLSHLFNCNRYISYRSTLHDAVRDQIHAMCNSYHIESFVEPLLRSLDINESVRDSEYGKRRADVVVPSFDDVMNVVDVVTVDVCKKNALKNAQSEVSPLDDSELYKRKKPIAIGESLTRLLSSLIFNRISTKARDYLKPFQFGIKTVEGASVASMTSDVFFNSQQHQYIFNLDFKNAFNSVKRNCIFDVLLHDFPELTAYFYLFYGKKSDLIFDSFTLESSSGVKQGDPLGPLLFCLAIHNIIKMTQQDFPDLRIVAYMDDISIIGSFESISRVSEDIAAKYKEIGLALNPSKCLLIGREKQSLMIGGAQIPFINYDHQAFKFLGCWLGNLDEIYSQLNNLLEKFDKDLSFIAECDIEKHIKFFILKICYSGKFTHILRSTPLRHVFCSADLGGIGFTKSSILCKAAFLGGGKNFVFEFFQRFPFDVHLINGESNFYLNQLQFELENLPSDIWIQCFPQNVQEIPTRSLPNLRFCLKKLQHHLVKLYEGLDYEVRLGLAKTKNPAFGNFLKDIRDSSAAALVTQVPSVYGLLLKDNEWLLNMRFRCFLWPNNLPNHLTCKCGKPLLFTHLLNCKHFITFRSKVHNNVRDQIYVMCKSYRVDSFLEPLLSKLILDDPNIDSMRYNRASMGLTRGDLVVPGLNGSFTILDAMSIDPCNSSNEHFINSDVNNPLLAGEKYKIAKYAKPISSVNENSHAQYNLCPFVFSLLGSLGKAAMAFLEDFVVVVKERTGRIFNRVYWQNRIVFSIFKGMVTLISDSLSSFGKFSESLAINCFDVGEAGFEDVEF